MIRLIRAHRDGVRIMSRPFISGRGGVVHDKALIASPPRRAAIYCLEDSRRRDGDEDAFRIARIDDDGMDTGSELSFSGRRPEPFGCAVSLARPKVTSARFVIPKSSAEFESLPSPPDCTAP
jgi:hypothetical protein